MKDENFIYFLVFLVCLISFFLYRSNLDNERLHAICEDQDETMQLQDQAISAQKSYISRLQYNYNNLYYTNHGQQYYAPNNKQEANPIH